MSGPVPSRGVGQSEVQVVLDPDRQGSRNRLLAIDTATSTAVVAVGPIDGALVAEQTWRAGYRHGEELLERVDALLREASVPLAEIAGIVAGTGPGAFTGLRVGLATAKGLARGLEVPIVGVATAEAILAAVERALAAAESGGEDLTAPAERRLALLLPAGPSDRTLVFDGHARLLPGGQEPELPAGVGIVAVDLDGRVDPEASRLGETGLRGLAGALLWLGASRLAAGHDDDVARLVPEYVTLPRGVPSMGGEVRWSRDPS